MEIKDKNKPITNPSVVLREEFDDWAILFDPDTGKAWGINPVGVFIWKQLNGSNSINDVVANLKKNCDEVPQNANAEVKELIDSLAEKGLVGYEVN